MFGVSSPALPAATAVSDDGELCAEDRRLGQVRLVELSGSRRAVRRARQPFPACA